MEQQLASRNGSWLPIGALLSVGLCLTINLLIAVGIWANQPDYLVDYQLNSNPDALDYVFLGRNFFLNGHYSRQRTEPFLPDMLRTPVYPLFAGGLDILGGAGAIYLAQALLQIASCYLLYLLVRAILNDRAAFWASFLLASDVVVAVANYQAMSEPLFVFLVLAVSCFLLPPLVNFQVETRTAMSRWFAGGVLLGLAILTRPAALYFPLVLGGVLVVQGVVRGNLKVLSGEHSRLPSVWRWSLALG